MCLLEEFSVRFKENFPDSIYSKDDNSRCFLFAIDHVNCNYYLSFSGCLDYDGRLNIIYFEKSIKKLYKKVINSFLKDKNVVKCWLINDVNVLGYFCNDRIDNMKLNNINLPYSISLKKFNKKVDSFKPIDKRLFSCCERKLLARLGNDLNELKKLEITVSRVPCPMCMPYLYKHQNIYVSEGLELKKVHLG